MKSSCHFLLNHLGIPTLQNSIQFSSSSSLDSAVLRRTPLYVYSHSLAPAVLRRTPLYVYSHSLASAVLRRTPLYVYSHSLDSAVLRRTPLYVYSHSLDFSVLLQLSASEFGSFMDAARTTHYRKNMLRRGLTYIRMSHFLYCCVTSPHTIEPA
jgi:hypothetical protein